VTYPLADREHKFEQHVDTLEGMSNRLSAYQTLLGIDITRGGYQE
jgi:hypothetical protein